MLLLLLRFPAQATTTTFHAIRDLFSELRSTNLVTGSPGLSNDLLHLVDLALSTAEGTELLVETR